MLCSMPCKGSCPSASYNSIGVLCPLEHHATCFIALCAMRCLLLWRSYCWHIVSELELVLQKVRKLSRYELIVYHLWYPRHQLLSFTFRRKIIIDPMPSTSHNALAVVSRGGQLGSQLIYFRGGIVPRDGSSNSCLVWLIPFQMLKPRTYIEIKFFSRNMVFFKKIPFSKSTFMVFPSVLCGSWGRAKS